MKNRILCLLVVLIIQACVSHKAIGPERQLFPSSSGSCWWIFGLFPEDGPHQQFLFTQAKEFTQVFWSSTSDSTFNCGHAAGQSSSWDGKLKFPLVLSTGDESAQKARLWMSKREFAATGMNPFSLRHGANLSEQLKVLSNDSSFIVCPPFRVKLQGEEDSAWFSIACLREADYLLDLAKEGPVMWLNLVLPGRSPVSVLLTSGAAQGNEYKIQATSDAHLRYFRTEAGNWTSPVTGRTWPLGLRISSPDAATDWHLLPDRPDQEIAARQASIWMGSFSLVDSGGQSAGKGDMIIFTR